MKIRRVLRWLLTPVLGLLAFAIGAVVVFGGFGLALWLAIALVGEFTVKAVAVAFAAVVFLAPVFVIGHELAVELIPDKATKRRDGAR